jgi:hypothetical protein
MAFIVWSFDLTDVRKFQLKRLLRNGFADVGLLEIHRLAVSVVDRAFPLQSVTMILITCKRTVYKCSHVGIMFVNDSL